MAILFYTTKYIYKILVFISSFILPECVLNVSFEQLKTNLINRIQSAWTNAWEYIQKIWPYAWPKDDVKLQFFGFLFVCAFVAERIINFLVPVYNQRIIDSLEENEFCWHLILLCGLFEVTEMFFDVLQKCLWTPIQNFTSNKIQHKLFAHLHNLSLRWHLDRTTDQVLEVMNKKSESFSEIIIYIVQYMIPTLFDVIASVLFLSYTLDWYFGLIGIFAMIFYAHFKTLMRDWKTKIIEYYKTNDDDDNDDQISRSIDSLLNYQTVKYCVTEKYEVKNYIKRLSNSQKDRQKSDMVDDVFSIAKNIIMKTTSIIGSIYCAYLVAHSNLSTGQYYLFTTNISRMTSPLNSIKYMYKEIRKYHSDTKEILDIFETKEEVTDAPDAVELHTVKGKITVSNVSFFYTPARTILKNISFEVQPGKTTAIVGPTGSGKSTIIRLLFRFYDVNEGSICVDGQNIKSIKQDSLRQAIGVVPQDTVLFNESIMYNIRYGRLDATDEEVYEAARAADIHEHIMNFPEKYETQVGERGLKLSGGEKQRIVIARTILKAPRIVLLDEATSALDTQTERKIQAALSKVCSNRTTVIVAHRLSTIVHADEIIVLKDGKIIERGSHRKLLRKNGVYADMWNVQRRDKEVETRSTDNSDASE